MNAGALKYEVRVQTRSTPIATKAAEIREFCMTAQAVARLDTAGIHTMQEATLTRRISIAAATLILAPGLRFTHGAEPARVILNVAPTAAATDPGPQALLGGAIPSNATQYAWADFTVEGGGDCRIYFDYANADHYHFL